MSILNLLQILQLVQNMKDTYNSFKQDKSQNSHPRNFNRQRPIRHGNRQQNRRPRSIWI